MALQTIPGGLIYPNPLPTVVNGGPSYGTTTLLIDAASEKAAFIIEAPVAGDITAIAWRTGTVTTGATLDVRLETVDQATGDPSGTLVGTTTNGAQVVADANDNTWFTTSLTLAATVTKGQKIAVVIVNPAASFGNLVVAAFTDSEFNFPYSDLYTAAWAKSAQAPVVALSYGGTYYSINGVYPHSALTTITYNSGNVTQDEVALKFKVPFPCRVTGGWVWIDADENCDIVLYDSDGSTALATITNALDKDIRSTNNNELHYFTFGSTVNLTKDTFYYLSIKPTTTTDVILSTFDVASAAVMDACVGGQNAHYAARVDAGAWTATTTRRPFISLLIDAFDDGVGGGSGGLLVNPGMQGGMNG